jgi:hypothetical protein
MRSPTWTKVVKESNVRKDENDSRRFTFDARLALIARSKPEALSENPIVTHKPTGQ